MFLPGLGTALGAAARGLLSDKLPSREFLGREVPKAMEAFGKGLLNSFEAYGKNPFYGMP